MKKNLNRNLILTAVGLALSATAVYGQERIIGTVPFAFRAADGAHAAGAYSVISDAGSTVLKLRNRADGKAVILGLAAPEKGPPSAEVRPRLIFNCSDDGGCVLAQVWMGNGLGYSYAAAGPVHESTSENAVAVYFRGQPPH